MMMLLLAVLLPSLPAHAQTPPEQSIPLGFHLARGDSQHFEAARAAGAEFVVVVFNWANIEPEPGYHYWTDPDAAIRAAEFYGLELVARLDQPPPWAIRSGQNPPFDPDAYAAFAGQVAQRYGSRLAGVILWNEPNLNLEWNNQPPDAAAYVDLLKPAYTTIKLVAPNLPVALAGLASTEGEGDWAVNDLDYLQALYQAGAKDYFDVLAAHPYGFGRPPADAPEKYRPNFRRLELYRQIMEAHNDSKPVWVTELGWLTATDNPKSKWQVVSPQTQADYILGAIDYARQHYPWVKRLGIWQLNAAGDDYGFNFWNGPDAASPAYQALVDAFGPQSPTPTNSKFTTQNSKLQILAPDTIIRLGDRDTLHPHWVHLYNGGSLRWTGEFYLTPQQAGQSYDLWLETMQITQPTNRILINGREIGTLAQRARPDITSTWVTQKFRLPAALLQAGPNSLTLTAGPRNPIRQYNTARWENFQFRNVRLRPAAKLPAPAITGWQPQPSPGGWSETARLTPAANGGGWLTGNRPGQLWQFGATPPFTLTNRAGDRPDLVFTDILPGTQLAATDRGLFWRESPAANWQPADAPTAPAYTVARTGLHFLAGFENEGLWAAPSPGGPWQRTTLTATTVIDLVTTGDRLYAVTPTQIFAATTITGPWKSLPLPGLTKTELEDTGEFYGDKMRPRLWLAQDGRLVLRHQDRLWVQQESGIGSQESGPTGESPVASNRLTATQVVSAAQDSQSRVRNSPGPVPQYRAIAVHNWQLFGPEDVRGKIYSLLNCCGPGTIVGTNKAGLWQLTATGEWVQRDDGTFDVTDATELWQNNGVLFAAGEVGLFASQDGGATWQAMPGLPSTVSDLLVDPAQPSRWLAGTPAGIYRSRDAGVTWNPVSPPWMVWDLAFGPQERLFVGRSNGLAYADDLSAGAVDWQPAARMRQVFFLRVRPNPGRPAQVWSGTWGNNIAASDDGGKNVDPIHHGLETLTGLDLIWHPTPGQVTLATIEGLYRTDDGGQSWFKLPGPLAQQTVHSLLQTDDGAIWAGAANGLWVSRDFGASWAQVADLPAVAVVRLGQVEVPPPLEAPFTATDKPLVYAPEQWLWAGTERSGLWFSTDSGRSWQFGGLKDRTVYNIFFDPTRYRHLVAATDAGIFAVAVKSGVK